MGRKLRYTGRKQKPFTVTTTRGDVEITPGQIADVHPIAALELLRDPDSEFEPAPAREWREQEGQG